MADANTNHKVQLGFTTLILIALIVMIFGSDDSGSKISQLSRDVSDLQTEVHRVSIEVHNLQIDIAQLVKASGGGTEQREKAARTGKGANSQ